ncbi:MAG: hypothetical protein K9W44_01545 [Candidatus Lokiarchaeota archaeon]|nr:hypothetical protein [Candidatus Harpocratesius repetitus]
MQTISTNFTKMGKNLKFAGIFALIQSFFFFIALILFFIGLFGMDYGSEGLIIFLFIIIGFELLLGIPVLIFHVMWLAALYQEAKRQQNTNLNQAFSLFIISFIFQIFLLWIFSFIFNILGWNKFKRGILTDSEQIPEHEILNFSKKVNIAIIGQIGSIIYLGMPVYYIGMILLGNTILSLSSYLETPPVQRNETQYQIQTQLQYQSQSYPNQTYQPYQQPNTNTIPNSLSNNTTINSDSNNLPKTLTSSSQYAPIDNKSKQIPLALIPPTTFLRNIGDAMKRIGIWNLIMLVMRFFLYLFGGLAFIALYDWWEYGIFITLIILGIFSLLGFVLAFAIYTYEQCKLITLFQEIYKQSKHQLIRRYIAYHIVSVTSLNANIFLVSFVSRLLAFNALKNWGEQLSLHFRDYTANEIRNSLNFLFWAQIIQILPLLGIIQPLAYLKVASSMQNASLSDAFSYDSTRFLGPQKICPICGVLHFP